MDAIRQQLAADLVKAQDALAAAHAESAQLRAERDEWKRTVIRERADRKAERDRRASAVRWSVP